LDGKRTNPGRGSEVIFYFLISISYNKLFKKERGGSIFEKKL
jgi:hypothetical protein